MRLRLERLVWDVLSGSIRAPLPLVVAWWAMSLAPAASQSAPAYLPSAPTQRDWSGTWVMTKSDFFVTGVNPNAHHGDGIPLAPKYRKIFDAHGKLSEYSVEANTNPQSYCLSPGVPGELEHPDVRFEFLLTRGRVTIIVESGTVRRIWTDGRQFPEHVEPSPQGYSIGHWENDGRTLDVETRFIATTSDLLGHGPLKDTAQTRVTERFSIKSGQRLELQATVTDPEMFTRPYVYTRQFKKLPGTFDVGDCALYNRDNDHGAVDLTPPPDVVSPPN